MEARGIRVRWAPTAGAFIVSPHLQIPGLRLAAEPSLGIAAFMYWGVFTQKRLAMLELLASRRHLVGPCPNYAELALAEEQQRYQMELLKTVT